MLNPFQRERNFFERPFGALPFIFSGFAGLIFVIFGSIPLGPPYYFGLVLTGSWLGIGLLCFSSSLRLDRLAKSPYKATGWVTKLTQLAGGGDDSSYNLEVKVRFQDQWGEERFSRDVIYDRSIIKAYQHGDFVEGAQVHLRYERNDLKRIFIEYIDRK